MSDAEKYRAFARQCMGWAERAQTSIEHRETLLDMATTWAEVAARLDHQIAQIGDFNNSVGNARKSLQAASHGNGRTLQGNGSGHTQQTDELGGTKQQSSECDASAK